MGRQTLALVVSFVTFSAIVAGAPSWWEENRERVDSVTNHLIACYRVTDSFGHFDRAAGFIPSRHPVKENFFFSLTSMGNFVDVVCTLGDWQPTKCFGASGAFAVPRFGSLVFCFASHRFSIVNPRRATKLGSSLWLDSSLSRILSRIAMFL
jgi:hypothetical protein